CIGRDTLARSLLDFLPRDRSARGDLSVGERDSGDTDDADSGEEDGAVAHLDALLLVTAQYRPLVTGVKPSLAARACLLGYFLAALQPCLINAQIAAGINAARVRLLVFSERAAAPWKASSMTPGL